MIRPMRGVSIAVMMAAAAVSGQGYEEFLRANLFLPADMA